MCRGVMCRPPEGRVTKHRKFFDMNSKSVELRRSKDVLNDAYTTDKIQLTKFIFCEKTHCYIVNLFSWYKSCESSILNIIFVKILTNDNVGRIDYQINIFICQLVFPELTLMQTRMLLPMREARSPNRSYKLCHLGVSFPTKHHLGNTRSFFHIIQKWKKYFPMIVL